MYDCSTRPAYTSNGRMLTLLTLVQLILAVKHARVLLTLTLLKLIRLTQAVNERCIHMLLMLLKLTTRMVEAMEIAKGTLK